MESPYIKNMPSKAQIMYPVLKGNAAYGGDVSKKAIKHLLIQFNCLGIQGTEDLTLIIPAKYFQPI